MNLDLSIHRMAVREAETLGVAQVLIAKKRQDLDLKLLRDQGLKGDAADVANIDNALRDMDTQSRQDVRAPDPDTGGRVDKTA